MSILLVDDINVFKHCAAKNCLLSQDLTYHRKLEKIVDMYECTFYN